MKKRKYEQDSFLLDDLWFIACYFVALLFVAVLTKHFLTPVAAKADSPKKVAMSYLGMCNPTWPCKESLSVFDKQDVIRFGALTGGTFGEECQCVKQFLAVEKPKEVRLHVANSTCFKERGRVCHEKEVFFGETIASADKKVSQRDPGLLKRFRRALQLTRSALDNSKSITCFVSPCLECDLSKKSREILIAETRSAIPQCTIIDNPLKDSCIPGVKCEKHGSKAKGFIRDLDGEDFQKVDMPKYFAHDKKSDTDHVWGGKFNCIDSHKPGFVDPRKRKCDANSNYFKAAAQFLNPKFQKYPAAKPFNKADFKGCKRDLKAEDGNGGFTYKQSDTHSGVAVLLPRNYKDVKKLEAIKNGKVVATFKYVADFHGDGRPIFRSSKPIWDMPETSTVLRGRDCWRLKFPQFRID